MTQTTEVCPACGRERGEGCGRDDEQPRVGCYLLGGPQPVPQTTAIYRLQAWSRNSDFGHTKCSAEFVRLLPVGQLADGLPWHVTIDGPDIAPDLLNQGDFEIIIRRVKSDAG